MKINKPICVLLLSVVLYCSCSDSVRDKKNEEKEFTSLEVKDIVKNPLREKENIELLFNKWLDAQNEGDFEKYSSVYADIFSGIKMSSSRKRHFKKDGWLEDRKRMFKNPMKVDAQELSIIQSEGSAIIRFLQIWRSGSYMDEGRKQLVVINSNGELKISREEMLNSTLLDASLLGANRKESFGLNQIIQERFVVLDTKVNSSIAKGSPSMYKSSSYTTLSDVKMNSEYSKYLNKEIMVINGTSSKVRKAKLVKLKLLSSVYPHEETIKAWEKLLKENKEEQVSKEAFKLGSLVLIGVFGTTGVINHSLLV